MNDTQDNERSQASNERGVGRTKADRLTITRIHCLADELRFLLRRQLSSEERSKLVKAVWELDQIWLQEEVAERCD